VLVLGIGLIAVGKMWIGATVLAFGVLAIAIALSSSKAAQRLHSIVPLTKEGAQIGRPKENLPLPGAFPREARAGKAREDRPAPS
jgi:hypothetical protein